VSLILGNANNKDDWYRTSTSSMYAQEMSLILQNVIAFYRTHNKNYDVQIFSSIVDCDGENVNCS